MPPDTGPERGTTALACNAEYTYMLPPLRSLTPYIDSSTLDHPVGSALGETHRTPSEPCDDADDTDDADDADEADDADDADDTDDADERHIVPTPNRQRSASAT